MQFYSTPIAGVWRIEPQRIADERGYFARTWDAGEFARRGLPSNLVQCSVSYNALRGTLRGMHFQRPPHAETKLVRCPAGAIFDVALDLRPWSPTYLQWTAAELSAENGHALCIPPGCAHGFITLTDGAEVFYSMADPYVAEAGAGVRWNDRAFGIAWPLEPAVINARDRDYPDFDPDCPAF